MTKPRTKEEPHVVSTITDILLPPLSKEEDILALAKDLSFRAAQGQRIDPVENQAYVALYAACLAYLYDFKPSSKQTFDALRAMVWHFKMERNTNAPAEPPTEHMFCDLEKKNPGHLAVKWYHEFLDIAPVTDPIWLLRWEAVCRLKHIYKKDKAIAKCSIAERKAKIATWDAEATRKHHRAIGIVVEQALHIPIAEIDATALSQFLMARKAEFIQRNPDGNLKIQTAIRLSHK